MSMSDDWRIFSKITVSLVQNPTYFELKTQNSDLQSSNDTLSVLMYIAIFVAIVFIATTVYILSLTFKAKKSKRDNRTDSVLPKTVSVESP
jgi:heme/copper-type cytochrome/quinol oxidase subunit 2